MAHKDEPSLIEQIGLLIATLIVVYGAAAALLSLEKSHAPQAPTVIGDGLSSPPSGQPAALSFPLDYSASVRQCLPSGRQCTQERYYTASSKKGAQ